MRSSEAIRSDIRRLGERAQQIASTKSLAKAKLPELQQIDAQIKALSTELDDVRAVDTERNRLNNLFPGGLLGLSEEGGGSPTMSAGGARPFGVTKSKSMGMAPVAFDDATIGELYNAVVSGKSLTVQTKATTDAAAAPMAQIPDYRLPPLAWKREPTRVANLIPSSAPSGSKSTTSGSALRPAPPPPWPRGRTSPNPVSCTARSWPRSARSPTTCG